jgi:hypothetical protein
MGLSSNIRKRTNSLPNVSNFDYNKGCHMATNMLQLPYGNERTTNDGRRITSTAQRAWMELAQAKTQRAGISICSEVEARRNLHHVRSQLATHYNRRSSKENYSSLEENKLKAASGWRQLKDLVAHILLNVFQALGKMLDSRYLYAYYTWAGAPKATVLYNLGKWGGWRWTL